MNVINAFNSLVSRDKKILPSNVSLCRMYILKLIYKVLLMYNVAYDTVNSSVYQFDMLHATISDSHL